MKTAVQKLADLMLDKKSKGLTYTSYLLTEEGKKASQEQIAQEVLLMEKAIDSGQVELLDFGDLAWKDADEH